MSLEILATGSGIALQDGGRIGWRRYGVPLGGAMDCYAMRAANQLLANRADAPLLEVMLQGARMRVVEDTWLSIAGADFCPSLPAWTAREVKAGELLDFSSQSAGLFAYLAVPGGFVAKQWFGSVSVDLRNGLGASLKKGAILSSASNAPQDLADRVGRRILTGNARRSLAPKKPLCLLPGPQFEDFSWRSRELLVASEWTMSTQSDRTGYRLEGARLSVPDSIPSEPVLPGSFQVTGNGQPIVIMVDGPTVGGYPKIAILKDADRDRLAQCAPNTKVSFQWD